MSIEKISKLVEIMNENDLIEIDLEEKDLKIKLKKPGCNMVAAPTMMAPAMQAPAPAQAAAATPAPAVDDTAGLVPIPSPIVGTFYSAPSPDSDAFASVGDVVTNDTVVCIVEAMKIMNEVKAEISGTIEKVLVKNGEPVEYGQPLFLVKE